MAASFTFIGYESGSRSTEEDAISCSTSDVASSIRDKASVVEVVGPAWLVISALILPPRYRPIHRTNGTVAYTGHVRVPVSSCSSRSDNKSGSCRGAEGIVVVVIVVVVTDVDLQHEQNDIEKMT